MIVNKICPNCNVSFDSDKRARKRFCSQSCAAIFNNKIRTTKRDKVEHPCLNCNKPTFNKSFCTQECTGLYKSKMSYEDFKNGNIESFGEYYSPRAYKHFILKEQNGKCSICEMENIWNYKSIVFILDHIDGDPYNNKRENLRLICPNCDSQLDTYKSKNKGKGRFYRRERRKDNKSY